MLIFYFQQTFNIMTEFIFKFKAVKILPDIGQSQHVTKIYLQGSKLFDISSINKNQYPELIEYSISNHKNITSIVLPFSPKIQRLNISKNKQAKIQNIGILKTIIYQNLKNLQISEINLKDMVIFQLNHLETLNLSKNMIKIQQNDLLFFPNLKHLNLSNNMLNKFPHLKAPQLEHYDVSSNQIKSSINLQKQSFQKLQYLDISINPITYLPRIKLPSLKILYKKNYRYFIRLSQINQLQKDFYSNIQELNLQNNLLLEIPLLKCRYKLKVLNFSINSISKFQNQQFPSLKQLFLQKNQLSIFPVIEIPEIQILEIGNNFIKQLPQLNTPKITHLKMNNNSLENIRQFASGEYPCLTYLDLQQNKIQQLPKLNTPQLKFIYLKGNNLKYMEQFASIQYPELNTLTIGRYRNYPSYQIFFLSFPSIKAPKLQLLDVRYAFISDMLRFFQGSYPKLIKLYLEGNKPMSIVPKIQAPQLQIASFGDNQDFSQFFKGNYCFLRSLQYQSKRTFFINGPVKQSNTFQQVSFDEHSKINIKKLTNITNQLFNESLVHHIRILKIDIQMTTNLQFLSYINLDNVASIQCSFIDKTKIIKNLSKVNFQKLVNITQIQIHQKVSKHILSNVIYSKNQMTRVLIEKDQRSWRRMYRKSKPFVWSLNECVFSSQFINMLNGTKVRSISRLKK